MTMRSGTTLRSAAAGGPVWAVTSYYNPVGYRRRLANYRVFRRHLDLPLLAVEWSPTGRFELQPGDADILIQLGGGDVMWQKERLLNIGVSCLPPQCTHVAWLDCDVVFTRKGIADSLMAELERTALVQMFERVAHLSPVSIESLANSEAWREEGELYERISTGRFYNDLKPGGDFSAFASPPAGKPFSNPSSTGHAWAARRELLKSDPLFDAWILGGGDTAYTYAALGLAADHIRMRGLTPAHASHYLQRAESLRERIDGRVSWLPGTLLHLWHGNSADRQYHARFALLGRHAYDPGADLEPDPGSAVWRWSPRARDLAGDVSAYFASRFEDGRP